MWNGRSAAVLGMAVLCAFAGADAHGGRANPPAGQAERLRRALDQLAFRTPEGGTLRLSSLQGQVVVVNFWATWCGPCRKELPALDGLHASIVGQGGRVVAISIDSEARNVRRFVKAHGLKLPIAVDGPEGLARKLDLPHIPYTIVLDREGAVAFTSAGAAETAWAEVGAVTRQLLARAPYSASTPEGDSR